MMVEDEGIAALEAAADLLRKADALLGNYDVGVCTLHLDACIVALESRLMKARSSELPVKRVQREARSPIG